MFKFKELKDVGTQVFIRGTDDKALSIALKKFKKRIDKTQVLDIYKQKQFYTKPSILKRDKKAKSLYKMRKINDARS